MRPANLVTSVADILAGIALSGVFLELDLVLPIIFLCMASIALYGGGVVFNDVFDADLDAIERPERAIPSGKVSLKNAIILGLILLSIGIFSAFCHSILSGEIAIIIAFAALFYDKYAKHNKLFGPLVMGICRGANLLLGLSIIPQLMHEHWWICLIPILYIAAITLISQSEVHGGNRWSLIFAGFIYIIVIFFQLNLGFQKGQMIFCIPFALLHLWLIFKPLFIALKNPLGANIGKAVKAGVLALIIMDATWASTSGNFKAAVFIVFLYPISLFLAKKFAVT
jgi:UbiA prenyltransferase family